MRLTFLLITGLIPAVLLSGCFKVVTPESRTLKSSTPKTLISEHVDAFNAGDVAAMTKLQHPDIEWLSVNLSEMSVQVSGREALSKNMTEYFNSPTKVTGTLSGWSVNAPYVSVTETASWTAKDGTAKSQSSLTVYQLEDNLIRRVWYYPAVDK